MSQDYESALSEIWKIYATAFEIIGEEPNEAFKWVFKRAYQLGKQEKVADTVIHGWVARDKGRFLGLYPWQPKRGDVAWLCGSCMVLPINTFPDLTWESEPEEVEMIIKRKKNAI